MAAARVLRLGRGCDSSAALEGERLSSQRPRHRAPALRRPHLLIAHGPSAGPALWPAGRLFWPSLSQKRRAARYLGPLTRRLGCGCWLRTYPLPRVLSLVAHEALPSARDHASFSMHQTQSAARRRGVLSTRTGNAVAHHLAGGRVVRLCSLPAPIMVSDLSDSGRILLSSQRSAVLGRRGGQA